MSPRSYGNPLRPPNDFGAEFIKKNAFHDQGILVVKITDARLSWSDRELLKQIGERLYGKPCPADGSHRSER